MKKSLAPVVVLVVLLGSLIVLPQRATAQRDERMFEPAELVVGLETQVIGLELGRGLQNNLLAKLDAALRALGRGNTRAAVGQLRSFQNAVRARRGVDRPIFIYTADRLVGQADVIIKGVVDSGFLGYADPNDLFYLGGSILEYPKIYLTFWGWGPTHDDPDGEIPVLTEFLQYIGGTPYLAPMTQYYMDDPSAPGGKRYIQNPVNMLLGTWFDDVHPMPVLAGTADIEKEVRASIAIFGYDPDAIYFIATPKSRFWSADACAYHGSTSAGGSYPTTVAYVDFPYQPTVCAKLGIGGAAATTVLAFHEVIEAMNDPRLGDKPVPPKTPAAELPSNFGWVNPAGAELGDLCGTLQGFPALPILLNGKTFWIQAQWSNQDHGCVYSWP